MYQLFIFTCAACQNLLSNWNDFMPSQWAKNLFYLLDKVYVAPEALLKYSILVEHACYSTQSKSFNYTEAA